MPAEKTVIQIIGMMRSGNHAVINWLSSLFDTCEHRNNLEHDFFRNAERLQHVISSENDCVICSFEDYEPLYAKSHSFIKSVADIDASHFFGAVRTHRFFVLRDIYNCLASRMRSHVVKSEKSAEDVDIFVRNWLEMADYYMERPDQFILYNEWRRDQAYRQRICAAIGGAYSERTLHDIPAYGGGSSFDSAPLPPLRDVLGRTFRYGDLTFVGRVMGNPRLYLRRLLTPRADARTLAVDARWPMLRDEAMAQRIFRDPRVAQRNRDLFGFHIDADHVVREGPRAHVGGGPDPA